MIPCGVESSQFKLLTLRYVCVVPRNGIVAKHRSLGDDLSSPLSCVSETVDPYAKKSEISIKLQVKKHISHMII